MAKIENSSLDQISIKILVWYRPPKYSSLRFPFSELIQRKHGQWVIFLLSLLDFPLLIHLQQLPLQIVNCHRVLADFIVYFDNLPVKIVELIPADVACQVGVSFLLFLKSVFPSSFSLLFPSLLLRFFYSRQILRFLFFLGNEVLDNVLDTWLIS